MTRNHLLVGLAAGLVLFTACTPAAPPATQPIVSAPAGSAPATAEPAGTDVDSFLDRLGAAQASVKTYAVTTEMRTTIQGKDATMAFDGTVDQSDPQNVKMALNMDMAGMQMKMIQVDGQIYLQMAATGDTWMLVPEDQMDEYRSSTDSTDPLAKLREVKDMITGIRDLGSETVDGVQTTRYQLVLDGAALDRISDAVPGAEAESITYDLWIDSDDLLRRFALELDVDARGESLPLRASGTAGDYNEPVDIKAPPKNKIIDMPS